MSSIVFSDDFDNGRKPDWRSVSGSWSDVGGLLQVTALTDGNYSRTEEYLRARGVTGPDRPTVVTTLTKVSGPRFVLGDDPTDRSVIIVSTLTPTDCIIDVDAPPFIPSPGDGPIIP